MEEKRLRQTVLVIDDEAAIRSSYRDYLEDLEYRVFSAENGRAGLEVFVQEEIDLIVADLRMPEVDGFEVLREVTSSAPDIPIIVASGTGVLGDVVEALHLGAWDYILKPIEDFKVFRHAVENALVTARLKKENRRYQDKLERKVLMRTEELEAEVKMRRKAEIGMRKMLEEKEVLLQEVHHRVKNNMAIISALISLKEQGETDTGVRNTFQDLQQRIKTMALVHEKLYQSDNFREISVKDYFEELCSELVGNYNTGPVPVECDTSIEDLYFALDILIPAGLILNEIVINSMRHAFHDTAAPLIRLDLRLEEGEVCISISDNGCGFKAGRDTESTHLESRDCKSPDYPAAGKNDSRV